MEVKGFKNFLRKYFVQCGFEKIGSKYYRNGNGFLCMIDVGRSYYSPRYYFDYYFFLGNFEKPYVIVQESWKNYTPYVGTRFDFDGRKCDFFELEWSEDELKVSLDDNMQRLIFPPFEIGKKYLADNFGTLYTTFLNDETIRRLLNE